MSRTNYIFVDYENVQENDLDRIAYKPVKAVYVLGERHKNLPLTLVKRFLKYHAQVELVETGHSGKNALDLVLAQHIGETKKADSHGYFHIVSKDKDFDALIGHLKNTGTLAARHPSFRSIPVLMNAVERAQMLAKIFSANESNRPKKRKALESQAQATFGKVLSPDEVEETIQQLVQARVLTISNNGTVSYSTAKTS